MHAANKRTQHTPQECSSFCLWEGGSEDGFLKFLYSYHILNDVA